MDYHSNYYKVKFNGDGTGTSDLTRSNVYWATDDEGYIYYDTGSKNYIAIISKYHQYILFKANEDIYFITENGKNTPYVFIRENSESDKLLEYLNKK